MSDEESSAEELEPKKAPPPPPPPPPVSPKPRPSTPVTPKPRPSTPVTPKAKPAKASATPAPKPAKQTIKGKTAAAKDKKKTGQTKWKFPECIVIIFCLVNLCLMAIGMAAFVLGILAVYHQETLQNLAQVNPSSTELLKASSITMSVIGGVIVMVGYLGCYGVLLKSRMMVMIFAIILLLLIIPQFVVIFLLYYKGNWVQNTVKAGLLLAIGKDYDGNWNSTNPVSQAIDALQITLECCGVINATDFTVTQWYKDRTDPDVKVPFSCCKLKDKTSFLEGKGHALVNDSCPTTELGENNPYTGRSCFGLIQKIIVTHITYIQGISLAVLIIQGMLMCITCSILDKLEDEEKIRRFMKNQR